MSPDSKLRRDLSQLSRRKRFKASPVLKQRLAMNSRFVLENRLPDNRLVRRNCTAGSPRNTFTKSWNREAVYSGCLTQRVPNRHHDLLQRGIPCTLTYSRNRNADAPGSSLNGRDRVRRCHAQVIVTMKFKHCFSGKLPEGMNRIRRLQRIPDSYRIGYTDSMRSGARGGVDKLLQDSWRSAGRILRSD